MYIFNLDEIIESGKYFSEYDGKVIKTRLPEEIRNQLLTKNQWIEKGFKPKENAKVYAMHPASLNKKLCEYYLKQDVEAVSGEIECCAICKVYKNRYCIIMGEHVSVNHRCSEYEKKEYKK